MRTDLHCVVDCANTLGECPLWSINEKCLWWIDVAKPSLWRYVPQTGQAESWELPKPPATIALRDGGGLLIVFRRGYSIIGDPRPGEIIDQQHSFEIGEERLNDGRSDRLGRMWIGSMDRQLSRPIGRLYTLGSNGLSTMDTGFTLSNGIAWSPDGKIMYFAETRSKQIFAYDYNLERGSIAHRRVFTTIDGNGGPDGLSVDAHGNVWVAIFGAGTIDKYAPDGRLADQLIVPMKLPTSCTFGGADLDTLFITTSKMTIEGERSEGPTRSGGLWAIRLDGSRGQPEPYQSVLPLLKEA